MSGQPVFSSVRLSPVVGSPSGNDASADVVQGGVVVDLPPSSKFGFAWPAGSSQTPPPPPTYAASEEGSDVSGRESPSGMATPSSEESEEADTPTNPLIAAHESVVDDLGAPMGVPRMSRAFSMPLPSQLSYLQNPHRPTVSLPSTSTLPILEHLQKFSQFRELSLELADSVQVMIQTLLQVSPPQLLDPAKETFSACALSVPTPCMSALFTSMKNLNYISANMPQFCGPSDEAESDVSHAPPTDFDIGEMLQSVGDALSGAAAHAGVDLVLFHGDVGMKHVSVRGDESGISYALSHIVRQVIDTAYHGDSIEIGLFISAVDNSSSSGDDSATVEDRDRSISPSGEPGTTLQCTFEITHKFVVVDPSLPSESYREARTQPAFNTLLLRRIISRLGGTLSPERQSKLFPHGRVHDFSVHLEMGSLSPSSTPASVEDPSSRMSSDFSTASEPTLEELQQFTETLRGKKAKLYASAKGSFAHHLTSYLTAWGLDVSHVSPELGGEGTVDAEVFPANESAPPSRFGTSEPLTPFGVATEVTTPEGHTSQLSLPPAKPDGEPVKLQPISFLFIDDDVEILRQRLLKFRAEQPYHLTLHPRKRPSLASQHRPRSSPQVARAMGITPTVPAPCSSVVIVHFTSLGNYKQVKDVVQIALGPRPGQNLILPEVMIIPKPVGPRRFLTALYTAITKPVVDPFFLPIATSPISPGLYAPYLNFSNAASNPKSPAPGRPSGVARTSSDRSGKSPKESPYEPGHLPPSPLGMSDGMEYFSEAAAKLGTSPSSGLVIQSPDGQPAGIFFHPRAKSTRNSSTGSVPMERDRGQLFITTERRGSTSRRPLSEDTRSPQGNMSFSALHAAAAAAKSPQPAGTEDLDGSGLTPLSSKVKAKARQSSPRTEEIPPLHEQEEAPSSTIRRSTPLMRKVSTPPGSPVVEGGANPPSRRPTGRRQATTDAKPATTSSNGVKKPKNAPDSNIVPPISVLIVDDNPINQTILSTFMKKKKIKYDVAKNGEEAVEKWSSGGFHLILMDIQMPIMDGIEATKEIRRLEKNAVGFPSTPESYGEEQRTPIRTPSDSDSRPSASPYRSSVIIVALTASSLQSDRVAALAAGCNDFLTKPVSLQWLNNKIIEWGSIKALQMWADLRPEVLRVISNDQAVQARSVAQRLRVPDERRTPMDSPSRATNAATPLGALDSQFTAVKALAESIPTQHVSSSGGESLNSGSNSSADSSPPTHVEGQPPFANTEPIQTPSVQPIQPLKAPTTDTGPIGLGLTNAEPPMEESAISTFERVSVPGLYQPTPDDSKISPPQSMDDNKDIQNTGKDVATDGARPSEP